MGFRAVMGKHLVLEALGTHTNLQAKNITKRGISEGRLFSLRQKVQRRSILFVVRRGHL